MKKKYDISCNQEEFNEFQPQIDKLLELMNRDPTNTLITDLSRFLDFFDQFTYPTLEDAQAALDASLKKEHLEVRISVTSTFVDAAHKILAMYPNWPKSETLQ